MTVFSKTVLAAAIAAATFGVKAELAALDDQTMGALTGQAGLTIDLETKYTIGEFMYKDAGSIFFSGISFGANENVDAGGFFDNVRIKLDIAGQGDGNKLNPGVNGDDDYLDTGFSGLQKAASTQAAASTGTDFDRLESGLISVAEATSAGLIENNSLDVGDMNITNKKVYGDGDLLIHVSYKDAWEKLGGLEQLLVDGTLESVSYAQFVNQGLTKGKDFNFSIDAIGLAASTKEAGFSVLDTTPASGVSDGVLRDDAAALAAGNDGLVDGDTETTVLISDLSINGYLGPVDIHIENNGNGFGGNAGFGDADSKINWNTYVNVTDLDVYIDNWDGLSGIKIDDMKINNVRGDVTDLDGNFAFGFAQSKREIFAVRNTVGFAIDSSNVGDAQTAAAGGQAALVSIYGLDGIAINTVFKGDKEIGALSFGDSGVSIGKLYWTDIESTVNWTVSGH